MIDFKLRVEVDKFNAACREMRGTLGDSVTLQRVISYEVARILEATMRRTTLATEASVMGTLSSPWRHWDFGRGKKLYYLLNHYSASLWLKMTKEIKRSIESRLRARGLSRRAWFELGLQISPTMKAAGPVRRAISPRGHTGAENVSSSASGAAGSFGLTIENRSPLIRYSNGSQAFFSAVHGRRRYFEQNLAHGVFADMQQVAKKYPGLLMTVPPAAPGGGT